MKTIKTLLHIAASATVWAAGAAPAGAAESSSASDGPGEAGAVQILLDRAGFSPGSIDGTWGESGSRTKRSLAAFQKARGLKGSGELDEKTSGALTEAAGDEALLREYRISAADAEGPFAESIPKDWKKLSELDRLAYTSAAELLGEKFHSDPEYLKKLNPGAAFKTGETVKVPNVKPFTPPTNADEDEIVKGGGAGEVVVSEADKSVTVKNGDGKVLFYAPVTPGSEKQPMPSGTEEVTAFDAAPVYYFDPAVITEAETKEKLKIAPGPNSPVGVIWIDLSKEGYGIHGTPEPEKIGYTSSHGCIRLTNWDALKLAQLLKRGDKITFDR